MIQILIGGVGLGIWYVYNSNAMFRVAVKVVAGAVLLRTIQNWTLQWACHKGYEKLARALLILQADVNAKNFFHNLAPLHYAASRGHSKVVQILIDAGANTALGGGLNKMGPSSTLPIRCGVWSGDVETIKILHARTPVQLQDLYSAAGSGDINVVNWMMQECHFDVNAVVCRTTPLGAACEAGHESMVRLLVDTYKADVNCSNEITDDSGHASKGHTPLHIAAAKGYLNIIKFLLAAGADLNAKTEERDTIAHIACRYSQLEVLQYLCSYINQGQLKVDDSNAYGNTPLHSVAYSYYGDDEKALVFVLENWKPNVNAQNSRGATALHTVAESGELSRLKALIKYGATIDIRDPKGQTPIHYATATTVGEQKIELIRELLAKGANINDRDNQGRTPLHLAVLEFHHKSETLQSLIHDLHADINAADHNGRTPYHIACIYRFKPFIELLEKAKADPNLKDNLGYSPKDYKNMSAIDRSQYIYQDIGYHFVEKS